MSVVQAIWNLLSIAAQSAVCVVPASLAVHRGCISRSTTPPCVVHSRCICGRPVQKDHSACGVKLKVHPRTYINSKNKRCLGMPSEISIPLLRAAELCKAYRDKHGAHLFTQCWGCVKYSKGDPEKMCFYNPPTNDGCKKVNELFEASR